MSLPALLAALEPERRPGEYVFVTGADQLAPVAEASVREQEGLSLVVERGRADAAGATYDFVAAWITLRVHSALAAVGLTAAVSGELTAAGIPCNVIAGRHHDHLLVPVDRADEALGLLHALARRAGAV
jgi:hypothetical protein